MWQARRDRISNTFYIAALGLQHYEVHQLFLKQPWLQKQSHLDQNGKHHYHIQDSDQWWLQLQETLNMLYFQYTSPHYKLHTPFLHEIKLDFMLRSLKRKEVVLLNLISTSSPLIKQESHLTLINIDSGFKFSETNLSRINNYNSIIKYFVFQWCKIQDIDSIRILPKKFDKDKCHLILKNHF